MCVIANRLCLFNRWVIFLCPVRNRTFWDHCSHLNETFFRDWHPLLHNIRFSHRCGRFKKSVRNVSFSFSEFSTIICLVLRWEGLHCGTRLRKHSVTRSKSRWWTIELCEIKTQHRSVQSPRYLSLSEELTRKSYVAVSSPVHSKCQQQQVVLIRVIINIILYCVHSYFLFSVEFESFLCAVVENPPADMSSSDCCANMASCLHTGRSLVYGAWTPLQQREKNLVWFLCLVSDCEGKKNKV